MAELPSEPDQFDPGQEGRVDNPPKLKPKDAATLIIIKREGGELRVLMGERHSAHVFQPGRVVFPGGGVEPGDQRLSLATDLKPGIAARTGVATARARALALAAIRETFEETGVLVGERGAERPRTRAEAWRKFFAYDIVPRLDRLDLVARAITPPGRIRRFDVRFFVADAGDIAHIVDDGMGSGELLKPVWLTVEETKALKLPGITRRVLKEVQAGLAEPGRPGIFFRMAHGKPLTTWL